jgi:hypothetical protein
MSPAIAAAFSRTSMLDTTKSSLARFLMNGVEYTKDG